NAQSPSVTIKAGYFFPSPGLNAFGIPTLMAYRTPIEGDWKVNDSTRSLGTGRVCSCWAAARPAATVRQPRITGTTRFDGVMRLVGSGKIERGRIRARRSRPSARLEVTSEPIHRRFVLGDPTGHRSAPRGNWRDTVSDRGGGDGLDGLRQHLPLPG